MKSKIVAIVLLIVSFSQYNPTLAKYPNGATTAKIVGLLPVRNESFLIAQCLKGLAPYVDAIVIFDDASEDNTVEIIESLAKEYKVEQIIRRKKWHRSEPLNRSTLLKVGRAIGGTHFVYIDADEMFTANCLDNNFLREKIEELQPGDKLLMPWIPVWRSIHTYRVDKKLPVKPFVFCDDGICSYGEYKKHFIHTGRMPKNMSGKEIRLSNHGVLHFQAVNIKNMGIRQAWYRCIENIRYKNMPTKRRNARYDHMTNEDGLKLKKCPQHWYEGYEFFDGSVYNKIDLYRRAQVYRWFDEYGFAFFADLELEGLSTHFRD